MSLRFEQVLYQIRSMAESEAHKGRLFERLMKTWFTKDPVFADRFSDVWMWNEWARRRSDFDGADTGVDLVAEERAGGYCAIQVKCYAPKTRISKQHLDSFISASARAAGRPASWWTRATHGGRMPGRPFGDSLPIAR